MLRSYVATVPGHEPITIEAQNSLDARNKLKHKLFLRRLPDGAMIDGPAGRPVPQLQMKLSEVVLSFDEGMFMVKLDKFHDFVTEMEQKGFAVRMALHGFYVDTYYDGTTAYSTWMYKTYCTVKNIWKKYAVGL